MVRGDGLLLVGCVILNHAQPEPSILLIKSISSAGRSVTFMDFDELNKIGIPQTIKDRLPKPKVIVKVW